MSSQVAAVAPPVIEARGVKTQFGSLVVHENLDLTVNRGEIVALVGGSGSGKTTLMREIIMLLPPAAGSIKLLGIETVGIDEQNAFNLRRRFGMLFQQGALFSSMTIRENVSLPLREHTDISAAVIRDLAGLKISLAGLPRHAADKYPGQLSGGMLKRAALARALALDPDMLFLDEPTAGLDPVSAGSFDELILQLRESLGLTVMMVTHDLDSLWRITDRVAFLGDKHVIGYANMAGLAKNEHPEIQRYFHGPRARAAQETAWNPK